MKNIIAFAFMISSSQISSAACNFANVYQDIACYKTQLKKDQSTMNTTYQRLAKSYDNENKKYLEQSQQAWLKYRDAQCKGLMASLAQMTQGAGAGLVVLSCQADLTQQRLHELQQLLD